VNISPLIFKVMTVQIDIDEKMWADVEAMARDLNIDYKELFLNTVRQNLYSMKRELDKTQTIAEKERRHRDSYEKCPVGSEEFYIDEDQIEEVWKDL